MRRVYGLVFGEAGGGPGFGGEDLLDEEDERGSAVAEGTEDPEAVLVDPHVAADADGVVQCVQARE